MNEAYLKTIKLEWDKLMNEYLLKLKKKLIGVDTRGQQIKLTKEWIVDARKGYDAYERIAGLGSPEFGCLIVHTADENACVEKFTKYQTDPNNNKDFQTLTSKKVHKQYGNCLLISQKSHKSCIKK
jgi:hypothetical protein